MGKILAIGITHYPPLAGSDETMSWILKRMLQNPHLPEKYRAHEGWPEAMRTEWGVDEGTVAARAHRARLLQSLRKTRAQIDEFRPDSSSYGATIIRKFPRRRDPALLYLCTRII